MAATFAQKGRTMVRLSDIPVELRQTVAHELAKVWGLKGLEYALFLIRATSPADEHDVLLSVEVEKLHLVMAGKRPPGSTPRELLIPPAVVQ